MICFSFHFLWFCSLCLLSICIITILHSLVFIKLSKGILCKNFVVIPKICSKIRRWKRKIFSQKELSVRVVKIQRKIIYFTFPCLNWKIDLIDWKPSKRIQVFHLFPIVYNFFRCILNFTKLKKTIHCMLPPCLNLSPLLLFSALKLWGRIWPVLFKAQCQPLVDFSVIWLQQERHH